MRIYVALSVVLMLAACQGREDVQATVDAGSIIYSTQVAALDATSIIRETEVVSTVSRMETRAAEIDSINRQIFVTIAAGSTPTPSLLEAPAPIEPNSGAAMDAMETGNRFFFRTGVSTQINDSDGCVINPATSFNQSEIEALYATVRVINIQAGVPMRAEWYREGELVVGDDWTVPWDADEVCLWFVIDRNDTDFAPGSWTVQLYAEGFGLEAPNSFFINE